jgi:glucose/arabinose dehydrogenase
VVVVVTAIVGGAVSASARAVSEIESITLVRVVGGLRAPVDVGAPAAEPEHLYIVEQGGLIRTLARGRLLARPFLDIRRLVRAKELSGLFSLAFDPNYGRSRLFVVAYVGRDFDLHVVRYRSRAGVATPSSAHELLHVEMPTNDTNNHFGGDLAFGPDGRLYIGVGDASMPAAAQDPDSLLGKLIRLDAQTDSPIPELVALGLRNPWRFSFDRGTGDLYIGDVGARRWEEINYVRRGSSSPINFGWPAYEGRKRGGTRSHPLEPPPTPPLFVYPHASKGCSSVVGGYVYRGRLIPALRGRYLFGDFCSADIRSIQVVAGKARKLRTELSGSRLPGLLSSFGEDSRGELYAVAYTYKLSQLYRLQMTRH